MPDEKEEFDEDRKKERDYLEGLFQKLKNIICATYEPVHDPKEAELHYTTEEIYRKLQRLVPNELMYTASDVAVWLHQGGFTFYDYGEMNFEWMMKKA